MPKTIACIVTIIKAIVAITLIMAAIGPRILTRRMMIEMEISCIMIEASFTGIVTATGCFASVITIAEPKE